MGRAFLTVKTIERRGKTHRKSEEEKARALRIIFNHWIELNLKVDIFLNHPVFKTFPFFNLHQYNLDFCHF